jgi:hypothetical protein
MLAAAGEGDWEALARLQDERERLLEGMPAAAPGDEAALGELLACNRQLCDAVERERDRVAREWRAAQGRSQAIAAYTRA